MWSEAWIIFRYTFELMFAPNEIRIGLSRNYHKIRGKAGSSIICRPPWFRILHLFGNRLNIRADSRWFLLSTKNQELEPIFRKKMPDFEDLY